MPSSPSPLLRLELQATGEALNTWGTRLNTVISLAEQAIAGALVKPLSGNTTLTTTNYAADEARNATLIFTAGAGLAASPTVTVPQVAKQWFVQNRTAFPIVMTCGGTNITIPANRQGPVVCDGVNLSLFEPVSEAVAIATAATAESARQAGVSATSAASSAGTATTARNAAQTARDEAITARNTAQSSATSASTSATNAANSATAAANSAAGVNLPAVSSADAGKVLAVNSAGSGFETKPSLDPYQVGDNLNTFANPGPKWLRRNGARYNSSSYIALANLIRGRFLPLDVPISVGLRDAAYSTPNYVLVGQSGVILTGVINGANQSTDGWTSRSSGATGTLNAIEFGAGLFVAVGSSGRIVTSPDAATWTARTSGVTEDIVDLAWTGSFFLAVTVLGKALRSTNGIDWTSATVTSGSVALNVVIYAVNVCVLFGNNGVIFTTADGSTFTQRANPNGTGGSIVSAAYGAGLFVGVGSNGSLLTSANGETWIARASPFGSSAIHSIVFDGANFLMFLASGVFAISADGITFAINTTAGPSSPYVSLLNGKLVLVRGLSPYLSVAEPTGSPTFPLPNDNPSLGWIKALA